MKRKTIQLAMAAIFMVNLSSCATNGKDDVYTVENGVGTIAVGFDKKDKRETKRISRTYDLRDFTGIRNSVGVKIEFRQGRDYSIRATGAENLMGQLDVKVENGTLVLGSKKKNLKWNGIVEIAITAPMLNALKNSGSLVFSTEGLTSEAFTLSNSGYMSITAATIGCTSFSANNSGSAKMHFNVSSTGDVSMKNSGACRFERDVVKGTSFRLQNSGQGTFKSDVKAANCDLKNSGASVINLSVVSSVFNMSNSGSCKGNLALEGGAATFKNSGVGTLDVKCDCTEINAKTSGQFVMTISGTADKTEISSSGISKINTKGLNKF